MIAPGAICFGNLEYAILTEQKQKYLLLTQPIHTKCGRLFVENDLESRYPRRNHLTKIAKMYIYADF